MSSTREWTAVPKRLICSPFFISAESVIARPLSHRPASSRHV
jgi:hypothetical protein